MQSYLKYHICSRRKIPTENRLFDVREADKHTKRINPEVYNITEWIDGMNIDQLQPSRSKQRELLNQTILNMTKEEFDARNLDTNSGITATIRDNIDTEQGINRSARIQADESQCVFRF